MSFLLLDAAGLPSPADQGHEVQGGVDCTHGGQMDTTRTCPTSKAGSGSGLYGKRWFLHRSLRVGLNHPYIASLPCQHSELISFLAL